MQRFLLPKSSNNHGIRAEGVLNLRRGVVKKNVTKLKTKASRRPVPIHPALVDALHIVRQSSAYDKPDDWVFASPQSKGKIPLWACGVMQKHIQPALPQAKVVNQITDGRPAEEAAESQMAPYWTLEESYEPVSC